MAQRRLHPTGRRAVLGGIGAAGALAGIGVLLHEHARTSQALPPGLQPDGRPRKLTLACPHPAHDPVLALALHEGFLSRYNIELTVLSGFGSGREALAQLRPGGADIAIVAALSWLPRLLDGLDAKLLCGLQSGSARLLVDRHSTFKRIEDLHRHAIGLADAAGGALSGADRLFFSIMMRRKGMNPNVDVDWVSVVPDQFGAALASGRVQAVAGHDPVIWQVREQLHLVELASSMTGSYASRVSRILGIRSDVLAADPQAALPLVLAFQDAAQIVARQLPDTANILADHLPDMTPAQILRMLQAEGHAVHPVGHELREQIAQYMDELKLIGLLPDDQSSSGLAKRFCAAVPGLEHGL